MMTVTMMMVVMVMMMVVMGVMMMMIIIIVIVINAIVIMTEMTEPSNSTMSVSGLPDDHKGKEDCMEPSSVMAS